MRRDLGKDSAPGLLSLYYIYIKHPISKLQWVLQCLVFLACHAWGKASTQEVCTHGGRETSPLSSTCLEQNPVTGIWEAHEMPVGRPSWGSSSRMHLPGV